MQYFHYLCIGNLNYRDNERKSIEFADAKVLC